MAVLCRLRPSRERGTARRSRRHMPGTVLASCSPDLDVQQVRGRPEPGRGGTQLLASVATAGRGPRGQLGQPARSLPHGRARAGRGRGALCTGPPPAAHPHLRQRDSTRFGAHGMPGRTSPQRKPACAPETSPRCEAAHASPVPVKSSSALLLGYGLGVCPRGERPARQTSGLCQARQDACTQEGALHPLHRPVALGTVLRWHPSVNLSPSSKAPAAQPKSRSILEAGGGHGSRWGRTDTALCLGLEEKQEGLATGSANTCCQGLRRGARAGASRGVRQRGARGVPGCHGSWNAPYHLAHYPSLSPPRQVRLDVGSTSLSSSRMGIWKDRCPLAATLHRALAASPACSC